MEQMTLHEIAQAVSGKLLHGDENTAITNVSTDSRQAGQGTLFIALIGERFDAHDFVDDFFAAGGTAAIVSRELPIAQPQIVVEDTRLALGHLAAAYRAKFAIPFVGITGSAGKTTTRKMIQCVLSTSGPVCATQGNLNNDIGMPKTLLTLAKCHRYAVIEMGMNHAGEIRYMTKIAKPDIAVITNIGTAHIGNLGSQQAILRAKMEIFEGLGEEGTALLNGDDPRLWALRGKLPFRTLYYGIHNAECDVQAQDVHCGAMGSTFSVRGAGFVVPVAGEHQIYNALAAIAIGLGYGLPMQNLQEGVRSFKAGDMRQTVIETGGVRVIEDCYNASVESVLASLSVLAKSDFGGRKIAVLGTMGELGDFAESEHLRVGAHAAKCKIDLVITVGDHAALIAEQARAGGVATLVFEDKEQAMPEILAALRERDTVLVKASRAAKFEEISKAIQNRNL
ncbi:MAG: UDP-N-acetylmuramoyl-tripeptide--D-alanyl-D-alanine ligase [Oscillospiraceae bacterium]|nr:UDP-N-acetylmuramoyl-tripeptide--D-alanyl-D-alanine ligase [Oscillospiraceae bacterium]